MPTNVMGDHDCPRCGETSVTTVQHFLSVFGLVGESYDGMALLAIENGQGEVYPIMGKGDDRYVPLYDIDDDVPVWDEDDFVDAVDVARDTGHELICSWCYKTYSMSYMARINAE